jgi:hypothetical protein
MLVINVEEQEFFDPKKKMFFQTKPIRVRMEHSLISISKWEAHCEKPYLATKGIVKGLSGYAEELYYIRCMILGDIPEYIPEILLQNHSKTIKDYISKKHSATTINRLRPAPPSRQIVTTELIYYWIIKFGIPIECEKWHFNRLLMLIDVCNIKETPKKDNKLSVAEANRYIKELNKKRRGL